MFNMLITLTVLICVYIDVYKPDIAIKIQRKNSNKQKTRHRDLQFACNLQFASTGGKQF